MEKEEMSIYDDQSSYYDKSEESPQSAKEQGGLKHQPNKNAKKGGVGTLPFIMGNEIFEKVASTGFLANMIFYLTKVYHLTAANGANVIFIWSAVTNFLPMFGAFLSDSYLGRFSVIAMGSVISLMGMVLLWLTAVLPGARPPSCNLLHGHCEPATPSQLALLFSAFGLMSIGAGGIRPCSLAFGADQFEDSDSPNKVKTLQTFFNWYYASVGLSVIIAVTVIVYIQDKKGFSVGFGVPVVLMMLSAVTFLAGSPLYHKVKGDKNVLSELAQVVAVSVKNRHLALPPMTKEGWYHHKKGSGLVNPSDKLRFFNKACVIRNPTEDLNAEGAAADPWTLCTVQQVEDLKSIVRVLPIWSTGIISAVANGQHTFPSLQAASMDRHLGSSSFQIPAGSFGVFSITALALWVIIYDRVLAPRLARVTGHPRGLSLQQRMGIGQVLSCISMAIMAITETVRRQKAIEQGLENSRKGIVDMTAMWLVPFFLSIGMAEVFGIIGQIEFFYSELPSSLKSVAIALMALSTGIGNLVGSLIISVIKGVTGRNGRISWVSDELNKGHLDYYYWALAALCGINTIYYIICSWEYGEEKQNSVHAAEKAEEREMVVKPTQDLNSGYSVSAMSPLHVF